MNHGFIRVATASPDIKVADTVGNTEKIIEEIKKADSLGVKLLVFPELCITSASCGELFRQKVLLDGAMIGLKRIAEATDGTDILVFVGLPVAHNGALYNCAASVQNGRVFRFTAKSALANYAEYYEARYFTPAPETADFSYFSHFDSPISLGKGGLFESKELEGFKVGVTIGDEFYSPSSDSEEAALKGATVIVNLSASNETVGKREYRRSALSVQSKKLNCAYIYANCSGGESTTDLVYSGHSVIAENGTVLAESKPFEPKMLVTEIDVERLMHDRMRNNLFVPQFGGIFCAKFSQKIEETRLTRTVRRSPFIPLDEKEREERLALILDMQAEGLRKRVAHIGCKNIVVGISGGLDSALALLVMVKAMDKLGRDRKDIVAITMPCFGTTKRTKSNAEKLCEALNVTFREVNIGDAVLAHFKDIGQDPNNYDVTYENSQARERTQVLMDIANKLGGIVIGTGDLSELALGWATYNGDHMSMYGVNASIPKTLVRHIVRHYADNASKEVAEPLYDILATPVSPELIPPKDGEISQVTENLVGPYELHDFFLYYHVRYGFSPEKILRMAVYAFDGDYSEEIISGWLKTFMRRFVTQQFKRSCIPDGPKVGNVALSPRGDWRMPSDACGDLWKL